MRSVANLVKGTVTMATKPPSKRGRELTMSITRNPEMMPDIGLAAITSYRKQKEVGDFITFMLETLEHNSIWLNNIVSKQQNFRCALLIGAGPNRFQIQEIIYPSDDNGVKLEVELNDSEDHDKVALAALLKLTNADMDALLKYMKTKMYDNNLLKEDLMKGKGMGISYAVLRPINDRQFRVTERIFVGGGNMKSIEPPAPPKKRRKDDKPLAETILRKSRRKP